MNRRSRQSAGAIALCLVTVGCKAEDPAKDARCDPGGTRAAALRADQSLHTPPTGYQLVRQGLQESRYDAIETHQCRDVLLYYTLTPARDGAAALQAVAEQLKAAGWQRVVVDTRAVGAEKTVLPGVTARLQGHAIAADSTVRISVAVSPESRNL